MYRLTPVRVCVAHRKDVARHTGNSKLVDTNLRETGLISFLHVAPAGAAKSSAFCCLLVVCIKRALIFERQLDSVPLLAHYCETTQMRVDGGCFGWEDKNVLWTSQNSCALSFRWIETI